MAKICSAGKLKWPQLPQLKPPMQSLWRHTFFYNFHRYRTFSESKWDRPACGSFTLIGGRYSEHISVTRSVARQVFNWWEINSLIHRSKNFIASDALTTRDAYQAWNDIFLKRNIQLQLTLLSQETEWIYINFPRLSFTNYTKQTEREERGIA